MLQSLLLLAGGFAALLIGAEGLVRGASGMALRFGLPPLVIGLTVVAIGTSSPEVAVSVGAAWAGQGDIALGNVVGSGIFNVLFILGLSALIVPLVVQRQLVIIDVPLMIFVSVALWLLSLDDMLGRFDGVLLFAGAVAYIVFLLRLSRKPGAVPAEELPAGGASLPMNVVLFIAGLALLVLGARWLVDAAVDIARAFGVSELVIGLTVIAAGTSLPEVATSILAALRGERDIAVGNIVGSNIFNILLVLGIAAGISPEGIAVSEAVQKFDYPVMVAVAVACLPVFFTGHVIARWEGALFFAYYIFYTLWLVLDSTGHDLTTTYADAMRWFVLPLTAATLLAVTWREWRARRRTLVP